MGEIRKEIEKMNLKFSECVRNRDVASLALLYTEDACLLPTNSIMIQGREEIEKYWGDILSVIKDAVLTTMDIVGEGETITEIGKYQLTTQKGAGEAVLDYGKYMILWKHTSEGWKLHWDIWNTSLAGP